MDRISQEADVAGVELNATVVELEQGDEESMLLERAEADLASA